ncbi:MAG: molybdopterin-dependent oxidoreductase [Dermatophilaceae bacterium]|nr:molybdopterin-dependent oxidoreductase [Dermatophilaceae bacterium]
MSTLPAERSVDAGNPGYRVCPLCEATCGLEPTIEAGAISNVRGDRDDVLSKGFICPKGAAFGHLDNDPDRLRSPMVRDGEQWREAGWDEAFALVAAGLGKVVAAHGRQSVGLYLGNPNVHTLAGGLYAAGLARALGSPNIFSASTVDQMPKHVSCGLMFGDPLAIPVPDLDRTDFLLILGANPLESNGSLATAPDWPGRLKALRARGGRLVVVDPRSTRTAALADMHLAIRPGTDSYLLAALTTEIMGSGLVALGGLADRVSGLDELPGMLAGFTPELAGQICGIAPWAIRALARDLAAAPTAAVYGRIGTSTTQFGTIASWLVDVLNVLTGNLDRPGGAMFALAPHRRRGTGSGQGFRLGRWSSRVRSAPEVKGELPAAVMAEEMSTPGEGQIRAMITVAGNPVLSTPGGAALDAAMADLVFMVAVDPYLNETTRRADVILPPPPPSRSAHYDLAFGDLAIRNTARFNPPSLPLEDGQLDEPTILARLTLIALGEPDAPARSVDDAVVRQTLTKAVQDPSSAVHQRDPAELATLLDGSNSTEQRLDMLLRLGAYGDGFGNGPGYVDAGDPAGPRRTGLSLQALTEAPHGIDLGPLEPRIPEILKTPSGRVELAPQQIRQDLDRLRAGIDERRDGLVLIGRRHLRSNNSWMHNLAVLNSGSNTCTLQMHPDTAAGLGVADGDDARVTSRCGEVTVPVEVTDGIRAGVVSLPHGWGHSAGGTRGAVAAARPGVNTNLLTDPLSLDPLSGTSVLNGIPVTVEPARA